MSCVSCDICVYHLWFCLCFFPGVFLSFRVTGACSVTTDLTMRVTVRTTTTTTPRHVCKKNREKSRRSDLPVLNVKQNLERKLNYILNTK